MNAGGIFWFVVLPSVIAFVITSSWVVVMVVALLGWIIGCLMSNNEQSSYSAKHEVTKHERAKPEKPWLLSERVHALEQEVAELKRRLALLEQQARVDSSADVHSVTHTSHHQEQVSAVSSQNQEQVAVTVSNGLPEKRVQMGNVAQSKEAEKEYVHQCVNVGKRVRVMKSHVTEKWETEHGFGAWFTRGNLLLKVGALVLFLGLAFLLRYVGGQMPLGVRYLLVFGVGMAAIGVGMKLQRNRREYGLTLQGFGFGVMYLTTLAAVKLHALLSPGVAFLMMVLLMLGMILRALWQDAKLMAQVAVIGGLAAPVLVGEGGSHLVLFGYLALINTGIAVIAWFKSWRSLNLIGLFGTLFIATSWGMSSYQPEFLLSSELFLVYHWLLYTVIACLFARNTLEQQPLSGSLKGIPNHASLARIWKSFCAYGSHIGILDSGLLFGSALSSFGLQYALLEHDGYLTALAALVWAVVYGGFAWYFARLRSDFAVMKQAFAALFLVFITLSIPLAFEQRWTMMAWALEAALVYAFGVLQRQPQTRVTAMGVYLLAALVQLQGYVSSSHRLPENMTQTLLQSSFVGTFLAAMSGVLIYYAWATMLQKLSAVWERRGAAIVLLIALGYAVMLPMMVFGYLGCFIALAVYALLFAAAQWRYEQMVFSCFAVLCVLISFVCGEKVLDFETGANICLQQITVALCYMATAFALHCARWLPEKSQNQTTVAHIGVGWGVLWLALWLGLNATQMYLVQYRLFILSSGLWAWLLWQGGLLLWAYYAHWRAGLQSAALLSLLFAGFAFIAHADLWAEAMPLSGSLFLIVFGLLGALVLVWLSEKSSLNHLDKQDISDFDYVVHLLTLPLYLALWTRFSGSLAQYYWPNALVLSYLIVPLVAWYLLMQQRHRFGKFESIYWQKITPLLAIYAGLWLVIANFVRPPQSDLPYLPILNAVELGSLAVLYCLYRWLGVWLPEQQWTAGQQRLVSGSLPVLFLLLLSGGVMRLWHIFGGVDWRLNRLLASFGVQASLSIVWALAAIVLMVSGNRVADRGRWLVGASIMGVVVLKLFFVELGNSGGIARIVSFIVVGLLLLLVGWFAPVPPKKDGDEL